MRFRLCVVVLLASLLIGASAALAAPDDLAPDARLAQAVTYGVSAATLQQVVDDLTKQTGVTIRAGSGTRDWQVKERRVHVSFHDLPLGTALKQTAKTLGYQLQRAGADPHWTYRIYQGARGQEYEDTMRLAQTEAAQREVMAQRESALKSATDALAMRPEDALKLRDTDPWAAYLGGTDSGRNYAKLLNGLPADARELMLRGQKVTVQASDLPADLQGVLKGLVPQKMLDRMAGSGAAAQMFQKITAKRVVFQPLTQQSGGGSDNSMGAMGLVMVMGEPNEPSPELDAAMKNMKFAGLGPGIPLASLPLAGSDSAMSRVMGKMLLRLDAGDDVQQVTRDMMGEFQGGSSLREDQMKKLVPSPKPVDPRLLAEVDPLTLKTDPLHHEAASADLIAQLSKKTALSYVLEYYPSSNPMGVALPSRKMPLYQLLDSLQIDGLRWELESGVVRIRPKDWAVQRSYDVPESFLAEYRTLLKDRGWLDLDALSTITASLTDGQIDHRFLLDPDLQLAALSLSGIGLGSRSLLRLYAGLGPAQRTLLASSGGLPFDQLNQTQWQTIAGLIDEETAGAEVKPGKIVLKMEDPPFSLAAVMQAQAKAFTKPDKSDGPAVAGKAVGQASGSVPATAVRPEATGKHDTPTPPEPPGGPKASSKPADSARPAAVPADPNTPEKWVSFVIDMPGDDAQKPWQIEKTVWVPGKAYYKQAKEAIESIYKATVTKASDAPVPTSLKPAAPAPTVASKSG